MLRVLMCAYCRRPQEQDWEGDWACVSPSCLSEEVG